MRRKYGERKAVTVYMDEAQYKWVELQAEGNMSEWCLERILATMPAHEAEEDSGVVEERGVSVEVPMRKKRKGQGRANKASSSGDDAPRRTDAQSQPKRDPVKQRCRHGLMYCATCLEIDSEVKNPERMP